MGKSVIPEWVVPDVTKFSCKIGSHREKRECPEAVLHIDKSGQKFICQNVWDGNSCEEKHPYKYTFQIDVGLLGEDCDQVFDIKRLRKMNHE